MIGHAAQNVFAKFEFGQKAFTKDSFTLVYLFVLVVFAIAVAVFVGIAIEVFVISAQGYCGLGFELLLQVIVNARLLFALLLLVFLVVVFFDYILRLGVNGAHVVCAIRVGARAIQA